MAKVPMKSAIAELDGDEMTRVLWGVIKEKLLLPFVDLKTEYFDLGLKARDDSDDRITYEAARAIKRLGVGVKCATITSNAARVEEYELKQLTPSPNGIIRAELDGTVFRAPIVVKNVKGTVSCWQKPLVLGRHAYGDVYKNCEMAVDGPGKAELVFTKADGTVVRKTIMEMKGPGVLQGIHNLDESIESFRITSYNVCYTKLLRSRIIFSNCSGYRDWAPSDMAHSGQGCTSTIRPSAPAATAARAMGGTLSRTPTAWLGSTIMGT